MEFNVEFTVGGITFRVKGYNEDGYVDCVNEVSVWIKDHFEKLKLNTSNFLEDFEDQINDAIKEDIENRRLAAEDLAFEAYREEQAFGGK